MIISSNISQAQAANLVLNGDFELDPSYSSNYNPNDFSTHTNNPNITGWTKTSNNQEAQWISVIKGNYNTIIGNYDTDSTGKSTLRGGGYLDFGYLSQNLTTTPGQVYKLTYRLKTDDWPKFVDNTFQAFVSGEKIYELTNIPSKPWSYPYDPYTEYTYNFVATAPTTELKFGYRNPNGFFFLDDVNVEAVDEAATSGGTIMITGVNPTDVEPSVPAIGGNIEYPDNDTYYIPDPTLDPSYSVDPKNIVVNGSFETDPLVSPVNTTLPNPYITGWVNDSDVIGDGTYSFKESNYPNTGFRSLELRGTGFFSQILNTVVGQEYLLSYDLASTEESIPDNPFLGNIFRTYVGGNVIDEKVDTTFQQFHQPDLYKTRYEYRFVATAPTTELKFFGRVNHDGLNLDDVSVTPVPEPSIAGGMIVVWLTGMWLKRKRLAISIKPSK
ncbi:DUF642 domain-containing protein [Nostoc sp. TCL26-01]|uniref:DUF642 domain-containing protein n=1 Tax=Nostoc sp. TCL26-01 TaxID=2576904 RepID=UPI0015B9E6D8|nr:DUF642 domain-containing protein [Nostoc sp. TCL26-01]